MKLDYEIGLITMVWIRFHSFIDGVIYSITFSVNFFTGAISALGMILHEFPEGIVTYILLVRSRRREDIAFWLALIAAAVTTPLGTIKSYRWKSEIDEASLGSLLALSAGVLIYVGGTHLLPMVEREARRYSLIVLAAGIATALGIVQSAG